METRKIMCGDGKERFVPIKPSKYEVFGYPQPGLEIPDDVKELAKKLAAKGERDKLVILYLRDEPVVQKHIATKDVLGEPVEVPYIKAARGNPIAALVGFATEHSVHIGWSKIHPELEELPFTKTDALECAIIRGLIDTITISPTGRSAKSGTGKFLPKCVERALPKFVDRTKKKFKIDPDNVDILAP